MISTGTVPNKPIAVRFPVTSAPIKKGAPLLGVIKVCSGPHAGSIRRMLGIVSVFPLSRLQQSWLRSRRAPFKQATKQRGVAMSLVKKSDVKNHLSPHYQKEIHLDQPLSEPDATGFSVEE